MAVTIAVLVAVVFALARELFAPAPVMLGGLVVLVITDVVTPAEGFQGFSSTATLTIAGLFVVARALQVHGGLAPLLARMMGSGGSDRALLSRLVVPVAGISSVVANTPLVATLGPMVRSWSERTGRPASKFLMPLSFAAIIGGVITTIGTSTTLVVSGLVDQSGLGAFSLFEIAPLGLPVALVGCALLVILAPVVLPDRRSSYAQVSSHERDYTFRIQVQSDGPVAGATVAQAGRRNLQDVYLAAVSRQAREITPVHPDTPLVAGDVLTFVGGVDHVLDLASRPGFAHADETQTSLLDDDTRHLVEVVVGAGSPLLNRTPKEMSFRGHYGAAIVAIHRQGKRVEGKLGEIRLEAGDALLLMTDADFEERHRGSGDFAVVVPLTDGAAVGSRRGPFVLAVGVGILAAAALGVPILIAVLSGCLLLVGTRTLGFWDARASLDLDVLIVVASAIGLGAAVESSGIAAEVAEVIGRVADTGGERLSLAAVLLGTLVLTELVTNVAAAALMVPIALDVAMRVDADPRGWAMAVAIMASSSFLTPIGYQTNTIVYGLGGYRFSDYWRLGLPLTVAVYATTVVAVPVIWS